MYKRENLKELLGKANYKNADLEGSKVLIRTCLNVPYKNGVIKDRTRIDEALPLIKELAQTSKRVVITAHFGRPEGRDPSLSLKPVHEVLEQDLGEKINFVEEISEINSLAEDYVEGKRVFLVENIRFFPGEKSKDENERKALAEELKGVADIYINDAFADYLKPGKKTSSSWDIAKMLPSYVGPAFDKEVKAFANFSIPARPFIAVMGGAKIEDKLEAMNSLVQFADKVIVGGAMAYTILKAKGYEIGNSLLDENSLEMMKAMVEKYGDKILLPIDHVVVDKFEEPSDESGYSIVDNVDVPDGKMAVDIGPKTVELFKKEISNAKSILWNGPMGVFEWEVAGKGTEEIGSAITDSQAFKLAGGGDSIAAINKFKLEGFDHVSTGGGAMLAYIANDVFGTLDVIFDQI